MDKEKERKEFEEIEEIYDIIASDIDINILEGDFDKIDYEFVGIKRAAKEIISAGYRKADEVRKETAEEILKKMYDLCMSNNPFSPSAGCLCKEEILEFARVYGAEVDE